MHSRAARFGISFFRYQQTPIFSSMIPQKVLIIDDEEDLCHLMKSFFVPLGYEVRAAYTLSDGLDLVRSMLPDIIFIDNNLPDGLGWEQVDYIRSVLPSCRITLISAYKTVSERVQSNIPILEKPISLSILRNYLPA
jgi:DNA-binding response OmpR family regulator